jgi:hypothetical protein
MEGSVVEQRGGGIPGTVPDREAMKAVWPAWLMLRKEGSGSFWVLPRDECTPPEMCIIIRIGLE